MAQHIHVYLGRSKAKDASTFAAAAAGHLKQYESRLDAVQKEIERLEDRGVTVPRDLLNSRADLQEKIKGSKVASRDCACKGTKDMKTVTLAERDRKIRDGDWEAMGDVTRAGYQEIRDTQTNKKFMIEIKDRKTQDSIRLIEIIRDKEIFCKIYYDSDQKEYTCKLFDGGIYYSASDYFTDSKSDAIGSAKDMVRRLRANAGGGTKA